MRHGFMNRVSRRIDLRKPSTLKKVKQGALLLFHGPHNREPVGSPALAY